MYSFLLFAMIRRVLDKVMTSEGLSMSAMGPLWPQRDRFLNFLSAGGRTSTSAVLECLCSVSHSEVPAVVRDNKTSHLEVIQRSLRNAGFSARLQKDWPSSQESFNFPLSSQVNKFLPSVSQQKFNPCKVSVS